MDGRPLLPLRQPYLEKGFKPIWDRGGISVDRLSAIGRFILRLSLLPFTRVACFSDTLVAEASEKRPEYRLLRLPYFALPGVV